MSFDHPAGYRAASTTAFLQVESTGFTNRWDQKTRQNVDDIRGLRVAAITQKRPDKPRPGCIVVEVEIVMPVAAFLPMKPTAKVDIPDTFTAVAALIEVEAEETNEQGVIEAWAAAAKEASP